MKRAALHELIEFVTTNGSSSAAAAAGVNKSVGNKDASDQPKDGKEASSQSLLSPAFDPLFYQEMVNTVSACSDVETWRVTQVVATVCRQHLPHTTPSFEPGRSVRVRS